MHTESNKEKEKARLLEGRRQIRAIAKEEKQQEQQKKQALRKEARIARSAQKHRQNYIKLSKIGNSRSLKHIHCLRIKYHPPPLIRRLLKAVNCSSLDG
jgi:hypothetical protein